MKGDDGTLHVIHENTSEARQELSSQFQSEVDHRIESNPSSQQLVVSVQDKSAAFSHSLPDSNAVTHTSSQVVAQVPASEDEPQNATVGIKAPPKAVAVNSAVNSNTLAPTLPDSSSTEAISTERCAPNEDEQTGLSLTTTGNITLDLEQKDSNGVFTKLEDESNQPLGSEQPTGNTLQSLSLTEESSAVCDPRDDNSDFANSTGLLSPIAGTDHQRFSTRDAQTDGVVSVFETVSQTTNGTGDTQNDAKISALTSEILVVEAENQSATYTGDMQNDDEILVVESENQATTYTGDMHSDAEVPLLEAENETTAASTCTRDKLSDTEISMIEAEHRTTTTSHTEGTQNDADISMFETENASASAPGRSQSDAEASVVETGNHTTATSCTAATQKVLEFSAYDAKSEASTTNTYTQGDAETPETGNQTSHTGETQNETDFLMFDEVPIASTSGSSQGDTEISAVETEKQATTTRHTGGRQDAEISMFEAETKATAANTSGSSQGDTEISAVETEKQATTTRHTGDKQDAEISVFEAETKATAASTSGSSQSDVDTSVVETGKQTTYYNVTQNVFEIDFSDHSPASKRRNIESVPLLQHSEAIQAPEDYTDDAAKVCFMYSLVAHLHPVVRF